MGAAGAVVAEPCAAVVVAEVAAAAARAGGDAAGAELHKLACER